jgi:hypothetical protein
MDVNFLLAGKADAASFKMTWEGTGAGEVAIYEPTGRSQCCNGEDREDGVFWH